jgi:hypothetical protein
LIIPFGPQFSQSVVNTAVHQDAMSGGSDDDYPSEYSEGSMDTLQDLLTRFTLDFNPEYTLKLRHRWAQADHLRIIRLIARSSVSSNSLPWIL